MSLLRATSQINFSKELFLRKKLRLSFFESENKSFEDFYLILMKRFSSEEYVHPLSKSFFDKF
jgi:hypothetical protein